MKGAIRVASEDPPAHLDEHVGRQETEGGYSGGGWPSCQTETANEKF